MKKGDRAGFTLMEIIIAMALLAAAGTTMFRVFTSVAQVSLSKSDTAYNLASQNLALLYEAVRQDWWPNANRPLSLQAGTAIPQPPAETVDGTTFNASYTVNNNSGVLIDGNADGDEDYRRVTMTVSW